MNYYYYQRAKNMTSIEEKLTQLNKQVVALFQNQKYSEAIEMGKQALELGKVQLGHKHPNTISALNNLTLLYDRVGDHARAEPLRQWNLQILNTTLEPQTA